MSNQQQQSTSAIRETEIGFFAMFTNFYAFICYFFSSLARLGRSVDEGSKVIETYSVYTTESVTAQLNSDYEQLQRELEDKSKSS